MQFRYNQVLLRCPVNTEPDTNRDAARSISIVDLDFASRQEMLQKVSRGLEASVDALHSRHISVRTKLK